MVFGIVALSAMTATIAALLVREDEGPTNADILAELQELRRELARFKASRKSERRVAAPVSSRGRPRGFHASQLSGSLQASTATHFGG